MSTMPLTDEVLVELNVDPATATALQVLKVEGRLARAESKVLLFLNRDSFTTLTVVVPELWWDTAYPATDLRAWPGVGPFNDRATYVSHVPNAEDPAYFDVTFEVGLSLEWPETQPIRDFLVADAVESLYGDTLFPDVAREITSLSGDGQSVSYAKRPATPDAAGGQLSIGTLARFKRYNVGVSPTPARAPWPYSRA